MRRFFVLGATCASLFVASFASGEGGEEPCHAQCLQALDSCNVSGQTDCDQSYAECVKGCTPPVTEGGGGGETSPEKEQPHEAPRQELPQSPPPEGT